ncbi:hypothetical protein EDB81DRAFT_751442 [Dactylonectria macrodidyma]|uniref:Uncharacterized protein n=1 Tax=Dactylonectria macrodidyma TaxID=307937 RepID=A0A9P9FRZ0_9HYPO|nr:hypothetical protein EDB81DRAFT_751442 [Dactylonectria macrodidyma]
MVLSTEAISGIFAILVAVLVALPWARPHLQGFWRRFRLCLSGTSVNDLESGYGYERSVEAGIFVMPARSGPLVNVIAMPAQNSFGNYYERLSITRILSEISVHTSMTLPCLFAVL